MRRFRRAASLLICAWALLACGEASLGGGPMDAGPAPMDAGEEPPTDAAPIGMDAAAPPAEDGGLGAMDGGMADPVDAGTTTGTPSRVRAITFNWPSRYGPTPGVDARDRELWTDLSGRATVMALQEAGWIAGYIRRQGWEVHRPNPPGDDDDRLRADPGRRPDPERALPRRPQIDWLVRKPVVEGIRVAALSNMSQSDHRAVRGVVRWTPGATRGAGARDLARSSRWPPFRLKSPAANAKDTDSPGARTRRGKTVRAGAFGCLPRREQPRIRTR